MSLTLSAGMFKTFGDKYGERSGEAPLPRQMTWYKPGISGELGFQLYISDHFSVLAEIGALYSPKWECIEEDGYNWMSFELYDKLDGTTLLASGLNENSLINLDFSIKPKIYLLPGKKLNPFIFTGININFTKAPYVNNYWKEYLAHDQFVEGDAPDVTTLDHSVGLGINPGLGLEYHINEKISLSLTAGDFLVFINQDKYPYNYRDLIDGNLNAFQIHAGLRMYFKKIKEL